MTDEPKKDGDAAKPAPALTAQPEKSHIAKEFKHKHPLVSCRFDGKGRFLFAGSEDRTIQRWDLEKGTNASLEKHESWVFGLAASPDGDTLYSGGCDGQLIWWPVSSEKPEPIRVVHAHDGWIRGVATSPDGKLVATCGNDHKVRIWSAADGSLVLELPGHEKLVYRVAFHPAGQLLASADLKGRVIVWDFRPGKEARRLDAGKLAKYDTGQGVDYGGVRDLSFSAHGNSLVCSGLIEASNPLGAVSNPAILLFDWQAGTEKALQRPKEDIKGVAWGVRFHPAGFIVAVSGGTGGGHLWFWKPGETNEFAKFNLPNTGRDLDLHPDGLRLATAHHDGVARVTLMVEKKA